MTCCMQIVDSRQVAALLDYPSLTAALAAAFRSGCAMPLRHQHTIDVPGAPSATLLLMPAWREGEYLGVKIVNVFPGNAARGKSTVAANYILYDARDGRPLAVIDGVELTSRRTAAASVLAASYLAKGDASRLLIVGTGNIASYLARAYPTFFPSLDEISVWGRDEDKARTLASSLRSEGLPASPVSALADAVKGSDIISCATLTHDPLIMGEWLRPGQHVDLVGGFTPDMREADNAAIRRARVFVDTLEGALSEAGDIIQPMRDGVLDREAIVDLYALARGTSDGRTSDTDITIFKSVGAALEDLAAAILIHQRLAHVA